MKHQMRILQGLKLAAVLAVALSLGACANKNLGADYVLTSQSFQGFSPDVATKARQTPGVTTVGETRVGAAHLNGKDVMLVAVSDNIGQVIKVDMKSGSLDALKSNELLVSKTKADANKWQVGSSVAVE